MITKRVGSHENHQYKPFSFQNDIMRLRITVNIAKEENITKEENKEWGLFSVAFSDCQETNLAHKHGHVRNKSTQRSHKSTLVGPQQNVKLYRNFEILNKLLISSINLIHTKVVPT